MLWSELSKSECEILLAVPRSQSYSEVSKATGLSPSYVSSRIKRLTREARLRYWVDYRSLGLSPMYILLSYDRKLHDLFLARQPPFVRSVASIWDRDGAKLLIELVSPVGLERRLAYMFPAPPVDIWIKEWEVKFMPSSGSLVDSSEKALAARWDWLPNRIAELERVGSEFTFRPVWGVDEFDLLILREKEEFCFASLSEIGRKCGFSQQLASYHYRQHLRSAWRGNCVEHKILKNLVLYRVETREPLVAQQLLAAVAEIPSAVDAFIPQGEDDTVYLLIDEPLSSLFAMHKAILSIDGVRRAELLAYADPKSLVYHGLTVHLAFNKGGWAPKKLEEFFNAMGKG